MTASNGPPPLKTCGSRPRGIDLGAGSTRADDPGWSMGDRADSGGADCSGTKTVVVALVSSPAGFRIAIAATSRARSDANSGGGVTDSPGKSRGESNQL